MRTITTLLAGDHFVRNELLATALSSLEHVSFDFREVTLPWPLTPYGRVAEVDEASDAEDQLIEALHLDLDGLVVDPADVGEVA